MKIIRITILVTLLMAASVSIHGADYTFTANVDGYSMTFSDYGSVAAVGDAHNPCIPQTATGAIKIPSTVVNPNNGKTLQVFAILAYAFAGCNQLTKVTFSSGIDGINSYAFKDCTQLQEVVLNDRLEFLETYAFQNCTSLTSINLPNSVKNIGSHVFDGCSGITTVHLPYNVTSIEDDAFLGMSSLTAITVSGLNSDYSAVDGVLYQTDNGIKKLCCYPQAKVGSVFRVPKGVTSIEAFAFSETKKLRTCILPEGLTSVGGYAFWKSSITHCSLPESLEEIRFWAFYQSNIESIRIPAHLNVMNASAFEDCTKLKMVTFCKPASQISFDGDEFKSIHPNAKLVAPPDIVSSYNNQTPWTEWFNEIIGGYVIDEYNFGDLVLSYINYYTDYDKDHNDIFTPTELNSIKTLNMGGWDPTGTSIKGIELFPNLEYLSCAETNTLAAIDVTNNTKLKYLDTYNCTALTSLDVSHCPLLEELYCNDCSLTGTLELGNGMSLKEVWCDGNNLTKVNLYAPQLEVLHCEGNNLTALEVSSCSSLKELYCYGNSIGDAAMTTLIDGLPNRNGKEEGIFSVFLDYDFDNNYCSSANVVKAKAKNWGVYDGYMDPFGGGIATAINEANDKGKKITDKAGWYSLDGTKLSGKPTQKGVFLFNGRKVVI